MSKKVLLATISGLFLLFFVQNVYAQCPSLSSEEIRLAQTYDKNQNGVIDDSERDAIISDWKGGKISDGQFLNLMKYWKYQCKIPQPGVPSSAQILVIFPNGGETWKIGNTYYIHWYATGVNSVDINLLKGTTSVLTIATKVPATQRGYVPLEWILPRFPKEKIGTYAWKIPETVEPAEDYKIEISATENPSIKDESDNYFSIVKGLPEDPVEGTLSVDKTQAQVGESINLTISAQDDQGVVSVVAYFQGKWNYKSCFGKKECTATWTITENTPGKKQYCGYVFGLKTDGSIEGNYTNPKCVTVTVVASEPPAPKPKPTPPGYQPLSLEELSSMVASLQETVKRLQEAIERLTR